MIAAASPQSETVVAAKNALTLGSALAVTGGLALLVRLFIPRFLGPGAFGELRLAESFAEMLFIVLTFGVDMQLRREAATDPTKVRDYLLNLAMLRFGLGVAAIACVVLLLRAMGSTDTVVLLFVIVALAQVFLALNNTYAALEHAAGDVGWLARTNFATKAIWAVAVVAVLTRAASATAIAVATLSIEAVRFAWLTSRGVRLHGLRLRPDVRLAVGAVTASLPFFVNAVAHNLYGRVGIGWLAVSASGTEVGLYGAAANLAAIALLGMPLLSWVLVPSTSRAAAQSAEDLNQLVSGALRMSLLAAVPMSLVFYLGADTILPWLFGGPYAAAAPVLRILAPTVALTYVSTVCAIALIQMGRTWTVATISIAGLAATAGLNAVLIPWGVRTLGPAGGAQGAAWAMLVTEAVVTVALAMLSRSAWVEARLVRTVAALACGVAGVAAVMTLAPHFGAMSFVLSFAAFALLVWVLRGLDRHDMAFARRVALRPAHNGTAS